MNRAGPQPYQLGASLIELIVFIVVVSVSLVGILSVFNSSMYHSVNPIVQISAIELAQAKMDEILARKFDAASPTGGVPACGSAEPGSVACAGISPNGVYDDVGDFDGQVESPLTGYTLTTSVVNAGADLGLAADQARRITVAVAMPNGETIQLASYKVNF
ncbi:type II secretion system protein [Simiduia curdlanivorans]|uniref:Type II secretion system protein n=1 Tax=Simiduia curdlanivorans TaxID=1492769 RepID=A0ABV8V477_9GAMM|nr:type II secretion system protein [Simiduia curdlanivorans]MDN3640175.1 type II secretion system protein [Simiduia curdlanivorans]